MENTFNCVIVPYRIHCPGCGKQHIDVGEWEDTPHHTHLCEHCGLEFDFYGTGANTETQDEAIYRYLTTIQDLRGEVEYLKVKAEAASDSKAAYRERMLEHGKSLTDANARIVFLELRLAELEAPEGGKLLGLKAQLEAGDCGICGAPHGAGHTHPEAPATVFGTVRCRECYDDYVKPRRGDDGFCSDSCSDRYDREYGATKEELEEMDND